MMKSMIRESRITFKEPEKDIYEGVCRLGRQFAKEFPERYD